MIYTVCIDADLDKYRCRCIEQAVKVWRSVTIIGAKKYVDGCKLILWKPMWEKIMKSYDIKKYTKLCICNWLCLWPMINEPHSLYFDTDVWFNHSFEYKGGGYDQKNWLCLFANGNRCDTMRSYLDYVREINPGNSFSTKLRKRWWRDGLPVFNTENYYHGVYAYRKAGKKIPNMEKLTIYQKLKNIIPEYED